MRRRFWRAIAKYAAQRAGLRVVRAVDIQIGEATFSGTVSNAGNVTWKWS